MTKKKIYVSSTYKDLEDHRKAVKATLERAGFDVECMEKYPAFDERPADRCLADVAACDYYVLVLAWRYGFRPEENNPAGLSITHLEYEEAIRRGKSCFVFVLDPDEPWKRSLQDPDSQSPDSAICRFRDQVEKRHGRRCFTTPDRLAAAVQEPLLAEEQKHLSQAEKDRARIRDGYLDWLRQTCESVELLGLILKESQNVRLGQVYVPAVTPAKRDADTPDRMPDEPPQTLLLDRLGGGIALRPRRARFRQVHLLPLAGLSGGRWYESGPQDRSPGRFPGNPARFPHRPLSAALPAAGLVRPGRGAPDQGTVDPEAS